VKKKGLILVLAVILLLASVGTGTLAWLTAQTEGVVNTFTTSDIDIGLSETEQTYQMIPGYTISKDPTAWVKKGSEECYLFVKLEKSKNFDKYMTYEVASGWEKLNDTSVTDDVYYRVVTADDIAKETKYPVLKDNTVNVLSSVTKTDMAAAKGSEPTLTITAYASQYHKNATETFSALEAWKVLNPTPTGA